MSGRTAIVAVVAAVLAALGGRAAFAVSAEPAAAPIPVIVDLDIGDDIDDSFALAWLLASPAFDVRGISTAWGDTALRVRLVRRLLREIGRDGVPVLAGLPTASATNFSQARWASGPHPSTAHGAGAESASVSAFASTTLPGASVDFMLLQPSLCPTVALRIAVEADGSTRETAGPPNAQVCLRSDKAAVLDRLVRTLLNWPEAAPTR